MKKFIATLFLFIALVVVAPGVFAADTTTTPVSWHAQSLLHAIANMIIFAVIGIVIALAGFKFFDKCTPGDLTKEIIENKNVAAAIVGAAVILGVCIIVAAAMIG